MRRIISLVMIVILVSFSFTLYLPEAEAAAVNTCAYTKDNNFCVSGEDVTSDMCRPGHFYLGKTVSEVDSCKAGTCVPKEGKCLSQKSKIECTYQEQGQWFDGPKENVVECQVGCCNVAGSLCSIEEQKYCVHDLAGDDATAFDSTKVDEASCNAVCNAAVTGCYKDGSVCTYGAQEKFFDLPTFSPTNFHANTFCKDVLGCFADSHKYKSCGDGTTTGDGLNVYWYDSAGNREDIFEDCEYPDNFCFDEDGKGGVDAECRDTNCVSGLDEYAEPGEFRMGESLCVGVHNYHYTNEGRSTELKPYILSCQFGKIVADDSIVDRSIVCVEKEDSEGKIHATTIKNNWGQCHQCGDGGLWMGNIGDVFGYFLPPFSSFFLLITTEPCKGSEDFPVVNGDRCDERGRTEGVEMCGYGPLKKSDEYDEDVWAPIGSCNPLYPPSGSNSCEECGGGGDSWLNVCTVDECNALGDCKFIEDKRLINEGTAVAGGMWVSSCISAALLSQYTPIPGGREGILSTVAATCTGTGAPLWFNIYSFLLFASGNIAASASTQGQSTDKLEFELTEEGKVKLIDLINLQKNIVKEVGLLDTGTGGSYKGLGLSLVTDAVFIHYLGKELKWWKGIATPKFIENAVNWWTQKTVEDQVKGSLKKYIGKKVPGDVSKKIFENYGITVATDKIITEEGVKGLSEKAGEKAIKEEATKAATLGISSYIFNSIFILYSIYSLGESYNAGKCITETPYTNNKQCELCGPGEGQWFCTEQRCGILGADNGHCKWIPNDDAIYDGTCIPLDVSDANPPKITSIQSKIYDNNNRFVGSEEGYKSNTKKLDIDLTSINNAWRATNITIDFKTDEDSTCIYTKQAQQIFGVDSFGEESGYTKSHKLSVDFTDADKSSGILNIYLKCMDVNENVIEDDNNYVKVIFPTRPDTEPPVIKYIDPIKVMLPENTNNVQLQLISYDENRVGECRFSETSVNYNDMSPFTNSGPVDCPDLVLGNNKCNLFKTNVDLSVGGSQADYDYIRQQYPNVPEDVISSLEDMRNYFYSVLCRDTKGNIMEEPFNWTLNVVPGFEIEVYELTEELYNRVTFNISTGGNPTTCSYYIDGGEAQYNFTETLSTSHVVEHDGYLSEGSHTVRFECEDYPGNKGVKEATFNVLVDDLVITSAEPDDETFYEDTVELEIKTQGGLYTNGNSTCNYDNVEIENKYTVGNVTTHTQELTGLTDGIHSYNIVCTDDSGKMDSAEITFTIDLASVPKLKAVYTEGGLLSIETNAISECKYSDTNFDFETEGTSMTSSYDGIKHQAVLQDVFYIYCKNLNNDNINLQPFIIYP